MESNTAKNNVLNNIKSLSDKHQKIMTYALNTLSERYIPEKLAYAAIDNFDLQELMESYEDINDKGISSGYMGYSYHSDTIPFFADNKEDIIEWLTQRNNNVFGHESIVNIFKDSQYLNSVSIDEINQAIYAFDSNIDKHVAVGNLLTWMVGEEICFILYTADLTLKEQSKDK